MLTAIKAGTFPLPDAARPINGVELVQENVVPVGLVVVKLIADVVTPLQTETSTGWFTCAAGFTVTITVNEAPLQLPNFGLTV